MIKVLANDGIHPDGQLLLEDAGFLVQTDKIDQGALIDRLNEFEVIVVRSATKVTRELMEASPNLKVICRAGVGLDNIDLDAANELGKTVYNTPAASSYSVAELVFTHMLNVARSIHLSNREMPYDGSDDFNGLKKKYSEGFELKGKTLGILGYGRIGKEVSRIGLALGMKVLPVDLKVDEVDIDVKLFDSYGMSLSARIETVGFDQMLQESDVITCHVPSQGNALLGAEEIAKMKDGVVLINAARGGTIDEDALLRGLDSGKIRGAGLDVFVGEPKPKKELLNHPKTSVSPHIGASTKEAQANIGRELADAIIAYFGK